MAVLPMSKYSTFTLKKYPTLEEAMRCPTCDGSGHRKLQPRRVRFFLFKEVDQKFAVSDEELEQRARAEGMICKKYKQNRYGTRCMAACRSDGTGYRFLEPEEMFQCRNNAGYGSLCGYHELILLAQIRRGSRPPEDWDRILGDSDKSLEAQS
jgi:hypothetical protein